jgi:hypothetical protein
MSFRSRLARLERRLKSAQASGCPGCVGRKFGTHNEYRLHGGEVLTLPPIPDVPPCTCGRRKARGEVDIVAIVIIWPDEVTREEAEWLHANGCGADKGRLCDAEQ